MMLLIYCRPIIILRRKDVSVINRHYYSAQKINDFFIHPVFGLLQLRPLNWKKT
jgi:hypothetical protein